jgi:threonine synthase
MKHFLAFFFNLLANAFSPRKNTPSCPSASFRLKPASMKYISTRGTAPVLDFEGAMLSGLARDGGLYLPETWPTLDIASLRGKPFGDVAFAVARLFTAGSKLDDDLLHHMVADAYSTFVHPEVTPLKKLADNHYLLELFHGPTLAFKDVAMQLLVRMMDWSMARIDRRIVVVGATSGDTGGAAVEAFKHSSQADLFILHPKGLVSDVQRRQMTTVQNENIHNIAIEGTFDDCQAIVKALFNDHNFRDEVHLAGVNSINWARVMAQISYYIHAGLALGAPDRAISFTVPTGNFGDIFAGYAAKRMGLPIDRLIIATNSNDILDRTLKTGRYVVTGVHATSSPSMDIQVSSNFERLLYLAGGSDAVVLRGLMDSLKQSGAFTLAPQTLANIRKEFDSGAATESQVAETIRKTLAETGELIDTHTAVGVFVAHHHLNASPMVTLATAHPAKFPDAVQKASGVRPPLPHRLKHLLEAPERFKVLPNSAEAVKNHLMAAR